MKRITFGERKINRPMKSYEVGILGVVDIATIYHGTTDNIDVVSYKVTFNDRSSVMVKDPHIVVDDGIVVNVKNCHIILKYIT